EITYYLDGGRVIALQFIPSGDSGDGKDFQTN
ncbi:unnamed protein product, partial [Allacma fusca]